MLEKLDTLIAFVVVMLGVSLIITIFTQIISTVLGLRGSNLLWGVETLLNKLDPNLAAVHGIDPRALATEILTQPLISDSTFSRAGEMKWIGPIVNLLLRVPLVGRVIQRWRYATAIGTDELARALEKKAADLLAAGAVGASGALTDLLNAPDPEADRRAKLLNAALSPFKAAAAPAAAPALGPGYTVQLDKILQQAAESARQSVGKLEAWFNSSMDRVSQRFVMQMRLWTIAFAFCLAFLVHLDSFGLLEQISTNSSVRSSLVGIRNDMLDQAKAVIPVPATAPAPAGAAAAPAPAPATELPVSTETLQDALDRLKKSNPAVAAIPAKIDDGITTVKDAEAWLTGKGVPPPIVAQYRTLVVSSLLARADTIKKKIQKAGLDLIAIPKPYTVDPNRSWLSQLVHEGLYYIRESFDFEGNRNFLGILLTAAFLSLGAPFWYNALKNLSNLRTVVANKQDQSN